MENWHRHSVRLHEDCGSKRREYVADCLAINGRILMSNSCPKTKKLMEKEGFFVKELDVSEFRKGEGLWHAYQ
jgi:hypothetical protein